MASELDKYSKRSELERIVAAPEIYLGNYQVLTEETEVFDDATGDILIQSLKYSRGIIMCLKEMLQNAADNKLRGTKVIKITVDAVKNIIKVWNDGKGIPAIVDPRYNQLPADYLFGELGTSGKYKDKKKGEKRGEEGGQYGLGITIVNLMSPEFTVRAQDQANKKLYSRTWKNHMDPTLSPVAVLSDQDKPDFVEVTATIDFSKVDKEFKALDLDTVKAVHKCIYDLQATIGKGVSIYLNGVLIRVKGWEDYVVRHVRPRVPEAERAQIEADAVKVKRTKKPGTGKKDSPDVKEDVAAVVAVDGGDASESEKEGDSTEVVVKNEPALGDVPMEDAETPLKRKVKRTKRVFAVFSECYAPPPPLPKNADGTDPPARTQAEIKKWQSKQDPKWQVAVAYNWNKTGALHHTTFVNKMRMQTGGEHVNHVYSKLGPAIIKYLRKENEAKWSWVTLQHINHRLWIFINCAVPGATFDHQTKSKLITREDEFEYKWTFKPDFIRKVVVETGLMENLEHWRENKDDKKARKLIKLTDGRKEKHIRGMPKLIDAEAAGGPESELCTHVWTEGDSAKELFSGAGLSVLDRRYFGVSPLKGVIPNMLEAEKPKRTRKSKKKTKSDGDDVKSKGKAPKEEGSENVEIAGMKKVAGLRDKVDYSVSKNRKTLRIGRALSFTDPDEDGYHIKLMIVLMFAVKWPELLASGFLGYMRVPVRICKKGNKIAEHFNEVEHSRWLEANDGGKGWDIKHNKGLASVETEDALRYFADVESYINIVDYDEARDLDLLKMMFDKDRAEERKAWLLNVDAWLEKDNNWDYYKQKRVTVTQLIYYELSQWAKAVNERCLPSVIDSFKTTTRKCADAMMERSRNTSVRIAQAAGHISEAKAYHHGAVSMENTLTIQGSNFVGKQNFNIYDLIGQGGTRAAGGKNAGKPRYVSMRVNDASCKFIRPEDQPIHEWRYDEGKRVEPRNVFPVVPMLPIVGADGMGWAWATDIPCHDAVKVMDCTEEGILTQLDDKDPSSTDIDKVFVFKPRFTTVVQPFYRGFRGTIEPECGSFIDPKTQRPCQTYIRKGAIKKISDTELEITEIPGWTDKYTEFLDKLADPEGGNHLITSFVQKHTILYVNYILTVTKDQMDMLLIKGDLHKTFDLIDKIQLTNMVAFDLSGKIKKYHDVYQLIADAMTARLHAYKLRKKHELALLKEEWEILDNKVRFRRMITLGEIDIGAGNKNGIVEQCRKHKFKPVVPTSRSKSGKTKANTEVDAEAEADDEDSDSEDTSSNKKADDTKASHYRYLTRMEIGSVDPKKGLALQAEADKKLAAIKILENTTPKQIWLKEIAELRVAYDLHMKEWYAREYTGPKAKLAIVPSKTSGRKRKTPTKSSTKKSSGDAEEGDSNDDDSNSDKDDDDGDDDFTPLSEKKAKTSHAKTSTKAKSKTKSSAKKTKNKTKRARDSDDESDAEEEDKPSPAKKARKSRKVKSKTKADSDDEDDA